MPRYVNTIGNEKSSYTCNNLLQVWQRAVHIHVCLHSCSVCSGISGSWWRWQSPELVIVNPKVWLHHHIGNDWACSRKSVSSDTFLQAKIFVFVETAKEAVTVISQLQQQKADPEIWNTLYDDALKLAAKFEVQLGKPCCKTKTPRKCSHWHPLSVLEEGDVQVYHS